MEALDRHHHAHRVQAGQEDQSRLKHGRAHLLLLSHLSHALLHDPTAVVVHGRRAANRIGRRHFPERREGVSGVARWVPTWRAHGGAGGGGGAALSPPPPCLQRWTEVVGTTVKRIAQGVTEADGAPLPAVHAKDRAGDPPVVAVHSPGPGSHSRSSHHTPHATTVETGGGTPPAPLEAVERRTTRRKEGALGPHSNHSGRLDRWARVGAVDTIAVGYHQVGVVHTALPVRLGEEEEEAETLAAAAAAAADDAVVVEDPLKELAVEEAVPLKRRTAVRSRVCTRQQTEPR